MLITLWKAIALSAITLSMALILGLTARGLNIQFKEDVEPWKQILYGVLYALAGGFLAFLWEWFFSGKH